MCGRGLSIAAVIATVALAPPVASAQSTAPSSATSSRRATGPGPLPAKQVSFEETHEPSHPGVKFVSRGTRYAYGLAADEALLVSTEREVFDRRPSPHNSMVRMRLIGASRDARLSGLEPLPGKRYYVDGTSAGPLTAHHTFKRIKAAGVYPGIDLVYYGSDRQLEFDFLVAPAADPRPIALSFAGATSLALSEDGGAVLRTHDSEWRLKKPLLYQDRDGRRAVVDGGYVLDENTLRFSIGDYDRSLPLVIDPAIDYATYLGSVQDDRLVALETNAKGEVYVFGSTWDVTTFPPGTPAGNAPSASPEKCFVSKFDATGATLLYSVLFQDTAAVAGYGTFCDAMTLSPTGRIHAVHQSADLGTFVKTAKTIVEDAAGLSLQQTRLPGLEGFLPVHALKADVFDNLYVLGGCYNERVQAPGPALSRGFRTSPYPGHCVSQDNFFSLGHSESVLVKYDSTGDILYGTFIGGSNDDHNAARALALSDAPGTYAVFVAGATTSPDLFPVAPSEPGLTYAPYQETCATAAPDDPCADAFLTWFDTVSAGAASHRYSTYLGGISGVDRATAIALHTTTVPLGPNSPTTQVLSQLFLTGAAGSDSFPQTVPGASGPGVFVARFDLQQQQVVYSGTFGGSGIEVPTSIAVFREGQVAVAGGTDSADFPMADPLFAGATASGGCPPDGCAFVTVRSSTGDSTLFSTYLDNTGLTSNPRIAADRFGNLFVGATTADSTLATPGAFQGSLTGASDVLLLKIGGAVVAPPNQPPVLIPLTPLIGTATSPAGATLGIVVNANDPEQDPLAVTLTGPLDSFTSTQFAGGFLGAQLSFPIGTSTVTVTADDGHGGVTTSSAQVTILGSIVNTTGTVEVTPDATFNETVGYGSRLNPLFEPTVRVKLENVSSPGVVTLNIRTNVAVPPVPDGYQLGSPPYYYDLVSTVGAAGPFTVCIDITGMSFAAPGSGLRLFRSTGAQWTDVTTPSTAGQVCGQSAGVGTFAIFHPANPNNAATTIAGSGYTPGQIDGPGGDPRDDLADGGLATASPAWLGQGGLAFDAARQLLYTTTYASIRRVDLRTGIMDTIGGDGILGDFIVDPADGAFGVETTDNVDARLAHITNPNQLALDSQGNLYIAEHCRVRRIDRATNIITTIAGDGFCRHRGDGGPATAASLVNTLALASDAAGNLLIGDGTATTGYIRRLDAVTGIITTVAGNGSGDTVTPGRALQSGLPGLNRIAVAPNGDLYLATYTSKLLRIAAGGDGFVDGGPGEDISVVNSCALTTCAPQQFRGDGGPVTAADFLNILSIAVEPNGDVLVGDTWDARIRRIAAGADHVVTGAADEIIATVVGHNSGDAAGFNLASWAQAENYGLSAWASAAISDVHVDPRGGFFWINGNADLVRRIGAPTGGQVQADLSVSATTMPGSVGVGSTFTYQVTIANHGPATATGVTLTMPMPSGITVLGASSSCVVSATAPVTCEVGPMTPSQQVGIAVTARADAIDTVTAAFAVSAREADPQPANNTATVDVDVQPTADLAVSVLTPANGATVNAFAPLTFDVVMSNLGPYAAFTSRLRFELPAGVTFVSATMPGAVCSGDSGLVLCDIDGLVSGAAPHATIVVQPTAAGSLTSTFAVSTPLLDPNPGNNAVSITLTAVMLPAVIDVAEKVFVRDAAAAVPAPMIAVAETVFVRDTAPVKPAPMIAVSERVLVQDTVRTDTRTPQPPPTLVLVPATATATNATGSVRTVTALVGDTTDESGRVVLASSVGLTVRVQFTQPSAANSPLTVTVIPGNPAGGSDIIVSLATNSTGAVSSTAAQVVTAINASPSASGFVRAQTWPGNAGNGIVQARALSAPARVMFAIAGTTTVAASCVVSVPGLCATTYSSTAAGTDTISAYLDLNANGIRESSEPVAAAQSTWVASADLSFRSSSIGTSASPHRLYGFPLSVWNLGDADSGPITIVATLPEGVTYRGYTEYPVGGPPLTCGSSGNLVTCTTSVGLRGKPFIDAVNVSIEIELNVPAPAAGQRDIRVVVATVSASGELNVSNNTDIVGTMITNGPPLPDGPVGILIPIGQHVVAQLTNHLGAPVPVTLTFSGGVTQEGYASAVPMTTYPPSDDFLLKGIVYDVVTTAVFTPPVAVCFSGTFGVNDRLLHYENGAWRDVTAEKTENLICGLVSSLSPFAVGEADHAPHAEAGANQTVEATSSMGASVTLHGIASDPDPGDAIAVRWSEGTVTLATTATATVPLALGEHVLTLTVTDAHGWSTSASVHVSVRDTTAPVLTLPANITATATSPAGAAVSFVASSADLVDGSVPVTCTPSSGSTFPVGTTPVTCSAVDAHTNRRTGTFSVTVQPASIPSAISRFVALGIEQVWLRANARALTGDVGANKAVSGPHRPWNPDDDGDPDRQVEVIIGQNAGVMGSGSRVAGDTVWLLARSSVVNVTDNELIRNRTAAIRGTVTTPATLPLAKLPSFPGVSPGSSDVLVRRGATVTLPPGRYRRIQVERRGKLVLSGGLYQAQSIELDEEASVLVRGATDVRIKSELNAASGVRILPDASIPGLKASSVAIYVEGGDEGCRPGGRDADGDNAGPTSVHIGIDSVVQASIYAPNGTIWMKTRTSATGAFVGRRVRVGAWVTLTLDSAFK